MSKFNGRVTLAAVMTVGGLASLASAQVVVDGTRDAGYGSPLAVQTVNTDFGDNASELNAFYYTFNPATSRLNVLVTGNVEANDNKLVFFFDTRAGGQNTLGPVNPEVNFNNLNFRYSQQTIANNGFAQGNTGPGFTFDAGFNADYFLSFNRNGENGGTLFADFAELRTRGGGVGGYLGSFAAPNLGTGTGTLGGGNLPTLEVGYNDTNAAGVVGGTGAADQAAAAAVTTGLEFSLDVSALDITGDFKLLAFVNGREHDFVSNQFLPGLTPPRGNLGGDGNGNYVSLGTADGGQSRGGSVAGVNLASVAGDQYLTVPVVVPTYAYSVDANGNYSNPANFTGNVVPTGANGRVLFGNKITAPRTVTVDQDVSLVSLTFDNANAYTLAGANKITLAASPTATAARVLSGSHVISAPVILANDAQFHIAAGSALSLTGTINAAGKNLFKDGAGTLSIPATTANSLTVHAGTLRLTGNGQTVVLGATVREGAFLDITNSTLIVDTDEGVPSDVRFGEGWTFSSTLTGSRYAVGYIFTGQDPLVAFEGTPLDETALVLRATFRGDTNLDRTVNFADLVRLAQNYNQTAKFWYQGDTNGDNTVNFADLVALAQNYNHTLTPSMVASLGADVAADWALAQSLVPEPTSIAALVAATGLLGRRRK